MPTPATESFVWRTDKNDPAYRQRLRGTAALMVGFVVAMVAGHSWAVLRGYDEHPRYLWLVVGLVVVAGVIIIARMFAGLRLSYSVGAKGIGEHFMLAPPCYHPWDTVREVHSGADRADVETDRSTLTITSAYSDWERFVALVQAQSRAAAEQGTPPRGESLG